MNTFANISGRIPAGVYKLLLVVATVIWGLSFVVMKDAVDVLEPAYLIGFRFLATGLILAAVFWRRMPRAFEKDVYKRQAPKTPMFHVKHSFATCFFETGFEMQAQDTI